ncbi:MAG: Inner membrane protein YbbJ [Legionellaceae bacterium]
MLHTFIDNLTPWQWLAISLVFILVELLLTSGFLLGIALSAMLVGLLKFIFPELTGLLQLFIFGMTACLTSFIGYFYFRKPFIHNKQTFILNRRNEQYIGREFILSEPIINGIGRIKVDDGMWRIKGPELKAGTTVRVTGTDGMFLIVTAEPIIQ